MQNNIKQQTMKKNITISKNEICEINYIPFLDILLVILIIFMISSSIVISSIDISIPQTKTNSNSQLINDYIMISIDKNNNYFLNENKMDSLERLLSNIEYHNQANLQQKIFLKGDRNLPYDKIINLLDILKQNGHQHISLAVQHVN